MKRIIYIVLILISFSAQAQKGMGYFGKRHFVSLNVSPNFTPYTYMRSTKEMNKFVFSPLVVNWKFSIGYDFALTRKHSIGLEYNYDPSRVFLHGVELYPSPTSWDIPIGDTINYILGDPVFHVHSIQINHKFYPNSNVVGIGFHITSSVGMHFSRGPSEIYYTSELLDYDNQYLSDRIPYASENGIHYYQNYGPVEVQETEDFSTMAGYIGLQIGWDIPLTKFMLFEFAFGSMLHFGFRKYSKNVGPGYDFVDFWFTRERYTESSDLYANYEWRLGQSYRMKNLCTFRFGLKFAL